MKKASKTAKSSAKIEINPETKNSVLGTVSVGLAVLLMLASLEMAGPVGRFIYKWIGGLFGIGYYLLPITALLMAIMFFISHQRKVAAPTYIGAGLLILAGLGFLDIVMPERGGYIGIGVGSLEMLFGYIASLVITGTGIIAGLILTLNGSITFKRREIDEDEEETAKKTKTEEVEIKIAEEPKIQPVIIKLAPTKSAEGGSASGGKKEEVKDVVVAEPSFKAKVIGTTLKGAYVPPDLSLLKSASEKPTSGDLRANANIIKRTLDSFGIPVEMGEINIGPKVTRYTLKPAEGVKLTRLTALNPDLALALAAHPIRIEAPIPGKSLVGIEVPNKAAAIVRLGSLMGYQDFHTAGPLAFVIGRDVTGEPIYGNLEKAPHLLVAGATGSGKSIFLHSLLISFLYKNSPETLKLLLVDPKRVELSGYNGLPHLASPVITDGKKAAGVFRWAIQEMERRYEVLLEAGARDIRSYNNSRGNPQTQRVELSSHDGNKADRPVMPYLVIVVDELADLMAAYGREIEGSVVRLAQMARATGIHLVLATQRPSVEVITGLIKANIPCRAALQVASQIDSRTILDSAGAEKLLGGGDMLFMSADLSKPRRIQGAYIAEEEIKSVVGFIKKHNETLPVTNDASADISKANASLPQIPNFDVTDDVEEDDLYIEAVTVVREAQKASASLLQRRLKVGYARAARLLDIMEDKGIVGPGDGAKPREVYVSESGEDNAAGTPTES